jgi:1,4-alpha-glucan branching enzyme
MDAILMKRQKTGIWKTTVSLESGRYEYRFLVDGQWRDDPASVEKVANRYGTENCVRTVE